MDRAFGYGIHRCVGARLAEQEPSTKPVWLLRGDRPEKAFGGATLEETIVEALDALDEQRFCHALAAAVQRQPDVPAVLGIMQIVPPERLPDTFAFHNPADLVRKAIPIQRLP